jgi:hypothetical protein
MDRGGVDRSVVAPVATKPSQVVRINDWVTSLGEPRIVPFGAMHPDFPNPDAEIARAAARGIKGIKLHAQHQACVPTDPRMRPIYEAAIAHGMVVLFHAGGYVAAREYDARPADLAAVLDEFPGMACVLAHMGGYQWWDDARTYLCGRDVYLDTAYVPRNLPDDEFLALARDHGVDRVLFGTDGPWADAGAEVAYLSEIGFTTDELDAILWENAARLLGAIGG